MNNLENKPRKDRGSQNTIPEHSNELDNTQKELGTLLEEEFTQFQQKNPTISDVFDPETEIEKIRQQARGENKKIALTEFKTKLIIQKKAIAECSNFLQKVVEENNDVPKENLLVWFERFSANYGFSQSQKEISNNIIDEYYTHRKAAVELRKNFPSDTDLVFELTGKKLEKDVNIKIEVNEMIIVIYCNKETIKKLHGGQSWTPGGFATQSFGHPNVLFNVIDMGEQDYVEIVIHEKQHSINKLFAKYLETSKNDMDVSYNDYFKEADPQIKKILLEKYLIHERGRGLTRAKDEIIAMKKDGQSGYFDEFFNFYDSKNSYDYLQYTRNLENNDLYTEASERILVTEYEKIIQKSLKTYDVLAKEEGSNSKAIHLLTDKPLKDWSKTVKRFLEQKNKAALNKVLEFNSTEVALDQKVLEKLIETEKMNTPEDKEKTYKELVNENPNIPILHKHFSIILSEQGKFDLALKECATAVSLNKEMAEAYIFIAEKLRKYGNFKRAKEVYKRFLETSNQDEVKKQEIQSTLEGLEEEDKDTQAHITSVDYLSLIGKKEASTKKLLELFENLQNNAPDNPKIYTMLGERLIDSGELSKGITSFEKGLRVAQNKDRISEKIFELKIKDGQYLDFFDYFQYAQILAHRGSNKKTMEMFDQAIHLNHRFTNIYIVYTKFLKETGKIEKAEEVLTKAIKNNKDNNWLYFIYGDLLAEEDPIRARWYFEKALELNDSLYGRFEIINILKDTGEFEEALDKLNNLLHKEEADEEWKKKINEEIEIINTKKDKPEEYISAASNLLRKGYQKEALNLFQKAAMLDPQNKRTFVEIGNISSELGKHDDAIKAYKKSLDLEKEFFDVVSIFGLSYTLENKGMFDVIIELYNYILPRYAGKEYQKLIQEKIEEYTQKREAFQKKP